MRQLLRTGVSLLLVVGGGSMVLWGGFALAQGRQAEITTGCLVSGGATVVAMVAVFVLEHAVLSVLGFAAVMVTLVWRRAGKSLDDPLRR